MKTVPIWSYDNNSEGATRLKEKLIAKGYKSLFLGHNGHSSPFVEGFKKIAINWGFQREIPFGVEKILNDPRHIINASNKLKCFQKLHAAQVTIPEITTEKSTAKAWVRDGYKAYCRTTANGAYGDGIVVATTERGVVDAELYTKGVPCKREYRTYMFNGKMIDLVAAVKVTSLPTEVSEYNDDIRNWKGGYGWARNAVTIPNEIKTKLEQVSKKAMAAVGLDFGAIDIVRDSDDNLHVLEINTAPGWEDYTADKFATAIAAFYESFVVEETAPVARVIAEKPTGLSDEEWQIILTRRAERARAIRDIVLSTLKSEIKAKLREHGITSNEWHSISSSVLN